MTRARLTPRRRPTTEKGRETVDAILIAASMMLSKTGRRQLRTTALAERAGVGIGTLYEYFPSRDSVIFALIEDRLLRAEVSIGRRMLGGAPPEDALVDTLLENVRDELELAAALAEARREERIGIKSSALIDEVAERFAQTIGARTHTARLALASVYEALSWATLQRPELLSESDWRASLIAVARAAMSELQPGGA